MFLGAEPPPLERYFFQALHLEQIAVYTPMIDCLNMMICALQG